MKKLFCNAVLLLLAASAAAQNPNNFQKMVDFLPPAPNAASIIKHSEIALNKNTGSPSVNIPLFSVKGNKLAAGISIGYSSTGIKVDEIASRVGMGWALSAGGVITRTIRGGADELTTRLAPDDPTPGVNCNTYSFLERIGTSTPTTGYDAEPDLFNFNMNGNAGSFVLNNSMQPVLIPAGKYKVEKDFYGTAWNFKITTPDGIAYYFGGTGATEKTKRNNTCGKSYDVYLPNAWYLTKIEHPNGEVITLSYSALTYTYETGVSETRHWGEDVMDYRDIPTGASYYCNITNCPPAPGLSTCINMVSTQGVLLTSITAGSNIVNFTYNNSRNDCGDRLVTTIAQVIDGQTAGIFNFTYNQQQANMSYLNEYALGQEWTPYLTELNETSPDLVFNKTHKFVYNDPGGRPPRLSFSQDHWGYFNGKTNTTFIPKPTEFNLQRRFPAATANREPNPYFAGKGLLKQVIYPTGGIDHIEYEGNDLKDDHPDYQAYHEYTCSVSGTGSQTEVSRSTTFTIDKAQVVEVDITSTTQDPANYDGIHMQGEVIVTDGVSSTPLSEGFPAGSPGIQYVRYLNPSWYLSPGTYTLTYKARGASQTTTVKLKYYAQNFIPAGKNKIVGGVRVKRVMTGIPGENPVIKRYYYARMSELDASSLLPVPTPVYNKDYDKEHVCAITTGYGLSSGVNVYCHYTAMYSNSLVNLFNYNTGAISYNVVVESIGDNFEGGATETVFYAGSDVRPTIWWGNEILGAPLSNLSSPYNGVVKEQIVYKKPGSGSLYPIKKSRYDYTTDARGYEKVYGYAVNRKYNIPVAVPGLPCTPGNTPIIPSVINTYDAMRYDIDSYWLIPTAQTETIYDENGTNPVTTTSNMYFDNDQHFQLTRTATVNTNGETVTTTNTYPADFPGNPVYAAMTAKNILTPVITSKAENGTAELAKTEVTYDNVGSNNYEPVLVKKSAKGSALQTEGTINLYDAKGNILQFTSKTGVVSAIIWGYNYRYPVAQITNATYASAVAQLTGSAITALQTMDGAALRAELNSIRTNLPNATVITYTYKPMAGVTSITDANNKTNLYDYDSFNRLVSIKDQEGNVVKKNEYVYAVPDANAQLHIFFNDEKIKTYQCQCLPGYTGTSVNFVIPKGKYFSLVSLNDANAMANADTDGQEYANKNGKCISAVTCTGWQYKEVNCACEAGTRICETTTDNGGGSYTVSFRYHWSDNTTGPLLTETVTCLGNNKKMINCVCETGVKVCDYVVNNGGGSYTVNYHYYFSDNSNSSSVTETFTCTGPDKKLINCTCETAVKRYVTSFYDRRGTQGCPQQWVCTYYYRWSDNSETGPFTECSSSNCIPD